MESSRILNLIEEQRYDEVEALWLERLESGSFDTEELLSAAKQLRRHKERDRAGVLVGLLAERCREAGDWDSRLKVLCEMARFEPIEHSKTLIRETLLKLYPDRPALIRLLRHLAFDAISSPEDLVHKVKKINRWLECDAGRIVYHPRYGAGKIGEVNYNLDIVRIDFESRKEVALEIEDTEVTPLPAGHILREKLETPELLKQHALSDPGATVGRLLETLQHPMKLSEIREIFGGVIPNEQWTSWWNHARKHPQLVPSGKGTQAVYSWSSSAEDAETALREEFESADFLARMEISKRIGNRNSPVLKHFQQELIADAQRFYKEKQTGQALQLFDFLTRASSSTETLLGFSFEDLMHQSDPLSLVLGLSGSRLDSLKEKVSLAIPSVYPDRWKAIYKDIFFQEENNKIAGLVFEKLQEVGEAEGVIDRLFSQPHRYPALFIWVCEICSNPESKLYPAFVSRLDGRFLIQALTALDEPQFSPFRSRLKNALEKGLLLQILKTSIQKTDAEKVMRLLEHATNLEDYRRDRLKAMIFTWVPEMKQKDDRIFTTQEALTRKKKEMEQLLHEELPTNRKAVGEAAAHGDLRENAEYKAARERQDYLISRVEVLQQELSKARVLEPGQIECSEVRPGTKVTLKQSSGREVQITILGLWDSNPKEGIYSYQSAIAVNLLGKLPGDPVEFNGEKWIVEKIEPWM